MAAELSLLGLIHVSDELDENRRRVYLDEGYGRLQLKTEKGYIREARLSEDELIHLARRALSVVENIRRRRAQTARTNALLEEGT